MEQSAAPSLPHQQSCTQFPFHGYGSIHIPSSSNLFTDTPIHVVLVSLIPVVVTFVGIKYQGKTLTAFETHPVTITISVISLLVYACLVYVLKRALVSTEACSRFMTFAGSLSLVSLASMLLHEPLRVALYAFYCFVLVAESYSYGTFHNLYCWIRIVKEKLVNGFGDQNRERLPVTVEVVNRSPPNDGLSPGTYSYGTFHNLYCWIRIVKEKLVNGFGDQNRERLPVTVENVNRSPPNDGDCLREIHLHHIVAEPARPTI